MNTKEPIPPTEFSFDRAWLDWLKHNLDLGVPRPAIAEAMIGDGCAPDLAHGLAEAFGMERDDDGDNFPLISPRLAKTRWLLNSLRQLQEDSPAPPITERDSIDPEEFFTSFHAANQPVIYRNCLDPPELRELLSFERLAREFGNRQVEIQEGRADRDDYERQSDQLKSKARFGDFLDRALSATESNDFYMTANNISSNRTLIEEILGPVSLCPGLLDPDSSTGRIFLWIGPTGTFTPAHHDLTNNLFLQVHGSKEFRLVSSLALLELDNDRHCYLASSLSDNDEKRRAAGLAPFSRTVTLEAGDVLFIPLGWWHEVRGLSPSVSLSATNFLARNDFHRSYSFFGLIEG